MKYIRSPRIARGIYYEGGHKAAIGIENEYYYKEWDSYVVAS
jgi:hypothetical protein